jgi:hypothetical protein
LEIVTALTLTDPLDAYGVQSFRDTVQTIEELASPNGILNQTVNFSISRLAEDGSDLDQNAANANEFFNILKSPYTEVTVIVRDANGIYRIFGLAPDLGFYLTASTSDSGLLRGDQSVRTMTLTGASSRAARIFDQTAGNTLFASLSFS